jgi:hypothetical protein
MKIVKETGTAPRTSLHHSGARPHALCHSGMRHLAQASHRRPSGAMQRIEPGIHPTAIIAAQWIPGSRCARPE